MECQTNWDCSWHLLTLPIVFYTLGNLAVVILGNLLYLTEKITCTSISVCCWVHYLTDFGDNSVNYDPRCLKTASGGKLGPLETIPALVFALEHSFVDLERLLLSGP